VSACYLLAAIAVMALVWKDPASRIVASGPGDTDLAAWWMRYSAEAVAHWRLPALVTTAMNAPTGVSAMWNTSLLAPGVALSPVTLLFGPQVSLTVLLTVGFAGSAASLFWVLRQWGISRFAAVAGGLAYGFSPALTPTTMGHYHMEFAVFPPLIAHLVARLVTRPTERPLKTGAALGLLVALQLMTGEELLLYTGLAIVVGLLVAGLSIAAGGKLRSVRGAVSTDALLGLASGAMMAAGVFIVIAGYPLWVQFHGPLTQHGSPWLGDYYKNDLEGFVQPSRLLLIHSQASVAFVDKFQGNSSEYLGYLGWPMVFVLAFAAVTLWRRMLAVRVLAVTFVVLEAFSLGGTLLFDGHVYSWFRLPWYWLQNMPLAQSAIVDRFSIIADVCAAALLAIVIDVEWRAWAGIAGGGIVSSVRRRVAVRVAIGLATAVVVVPLLPAPLPTLTVAGVPAGWTQVLTALRLPGNASTLTVPASSDAFSAPMRWAADTGMPSSMVGGYFIGPDSNGQASAGGTGLAAVPQYLNTLWAQSPPASVSSAGVQTTTQVQTAAQASNWILGSGMSAVVAVTSLGSPLANYLTAILGPPAAQAGDVIGWRVSRSLRPAIRSSRVLCRDRERRGGCGYRAGWATRVACAAFWPPIPH
jgi:hypothetical protein